MSRERARRRAEQQAAAERERAARLARHRRRAALRRLRPRLPVTVTRRRHVARVWSRRTRTQRAGMVAVAVAIVLLTFLLTDSWRVRLAVLALMAIGAPALSTLALGRGRG